jgi:hypothetical protein
VLEEMTSLALRGQAVLSKVYIAAVEQTIPVIRKDNKLL